MAVRLWDMLLPLQLETLDPHLLHTSIQRAIVLILSTNSHLIHVLELPVPVMRTRSGTELEVMQSTYRCLVDSTKTGGMARTEPDHHPSRAVDSGVMKVLLSAKSPAKASLAKSCIEARRVMEHSHRPKNSNLIHPPALSTCAHRYTLTHIQDQERMGAICHFCHVLHLPLRWQKRKYWDNAG